MTAKAPAENLHHAIEAYVSGVGCEEVARTWRISWKRMVQELRGRGLWRDSADVQRLRGAHVGATVRARTGLPDIEIATRYTAGESENGLAKAFGVARSVIRARLITAGVAIRGPTDANRLLAAGRTPEENQRLMAAAHAFTRGRPLSLEHRCKIAATRERRQLHVSPAERLMAHWLRERGVDTIPQQAIGPYNADLGAFPVAVEIFGGSWHGSGDHAALSPRRARDILDQGWNLVIVWVDGRRYPLGIAAAEYVVAFLEETRRDPSLRGQYRVIRGDGYRVAMGSDDLDDLTRVPALGRTANTRPRH